MNFPLRTGRSNNSIDLWLREVSPLLSTLIGDFMETVLLTVNYFSLHNTGSFSCRDMEVETFLNVFAHQLMHGKLDAYCEIFATLFQDESQRVDLHEQTKAIFQQAFLQYFSSSGSTESLTAAIAERVSNTLRKQIDAPDAEEETESEHEADDDPVFHETRDCPYCHQFLAFPFLCESCFERLVRSEGAEPAGFVCRCYCCEDIRGSPEKLSSFETTNGLQRYLRDCYDLLRIKVTNEIHASEPSS